jgi:hypothetical protein
MTTIAAIKSAVQTVDQATQEKSDAEFLRRALTMAAELVAKRDAQLEEAIAAQKETERDWANSIRLQEDLDDLRDGMRTDFQKEWDYKYEIATRTLRGIGLRPIYPSVKSATKHINRALAEVGLAPISESWTRSLLKRLVDNGKATEGVDGRGVTYYKLL